MSTNSTEPVAKLNLDTAPVVLEELHNNVVPWIEVAEQLRLYLSMTPSNMQSAVDEKATRQLLDQILRYIAQYNQLVMQKLEQDRYR
jgi:hypothetical protein